MHKKDLIEGLRKFADTHEIAITNYGNHKYSVRWKGQKAFALYLIAYLEALVIPSDEKYDFWRIEQYLPQILTDAFEHLRTGTDELATKYRAMYEQEAEHSVPNILDLGTSNILEQASAVQTTLQFMMKDVIGEQWVEHEIDSYCNAQSHVLQHTFDKFVRSVYRNGMYETIDKCKSRGMAGKFGRTELRSYVMAGRIMLTFARKRKGKTVYYGPDNKPFHTLPYKEDSVSFVAEDGDPLALSAGIQSVQANFRTSLDMIEDVVRHWPGKPKEQKAVYKASKSVSLG